jgi:hypothetical protein
VNELMKSFKKVIIRLQNRTGKAVHSAARVMIITSRTWSCHGFGKRVFSRIRRASGHRSEKNRKDIARKLVGSNIIATKIARSIFRIAGAPSKGDLMIIFSRMH